MSTTLTPSITIAPATGTWVVRARGMILAESRAALELREGTLPSVYYFPRTDVAMVCMERTDKSSHCPHKGDASYYSIETPDGAVENAAWSYEAPHAAVAALKDHLAFYASEKVLIEQL